MTAERDSLLHRKTCVVADVRVGDWVRSPDDARIVREITKIWGPYDHAVWTVYELVCEDDGHVYELAGADEVEVWWRA
jgi:hypothetical protein